MSEVYVHGLGAVSPAGWGVESLCGVLEKGEALPMQILACPGWEKPLKVRAVPPPANRPTFFTHPRLRRATAIAQYGVAAALEALGENISLVQNETMRLGVIVGVMAGSVTYSRRFFEEVLQNPVTASPLIFPETVFNAPASHFAALLGSNAIGYTLVGDAGTFLHGLVLAAQWLADGQVDACVVIGAEETDWVVADAMKLFNRDMIHCGGAGAVLLKKDSAGAIAKLSAVTDAFAFTQNQPRTQAAQRMRAQLPPDAQNELLCASAQNLPRADVAEKLAWKDWPGTRLAPKAILGEAFVASAAWQCVVACAALQKNSFPAANISVVGANQQAIGARFLACAKTV